MASERNDAAVYLGWFFFGAALGTAVTLLLTPRTGRETRELLGERADDVARRAQALASEAQGRAGEWLDKSREVFEEQTQRLMSAFEAGKDAMKEEIRRGAEPA
jgi:gas vesicle protein